MIKKQASHSHTSNIGQIRIISGQWRGRKLPVLAHEGLRPTSNRLRETLFNWLTSYISHAKVLDCFAGTGALAFEALSRGASQATMLETNIHCIKSLKTTIDQLKATQTHIYHVDTLNYLSKMNTEPFDIIFLDPPFESNLLQKSYNLLIKNNYIHKNTIIYIETSSSLLVEKMNVQLFKKKTIGAVTAGLYYSYI